MTKQEFIIAFFKATHMNDNIVYIDELCFIDRIDTLKDFMNKYCNKFKDFNDYITKGIKDLIESFDENDMENKDYEYLKELSRQYEEYDYQNIYYDKEYDLYYTDNGYINIFEAFLKKYNIYDTFYEKGTESFTKKDFLLKYAYMVFSNDDNLKTYIQRKDIELINNSMSNKEIYEYLESTDNLKDFIDFIENNNYEDILNL